MRGMRLTTDRNQAAARHASSRRTIPAFTAGPQAAAKLSFGAATTTRSEVRRDKPNAGELRRR